MQTDSCQVPARGRPGKNRHSLRWEGERFRAQLHPCLARKSSNIELEAINRECLSRDETRLGGRQKSHQTGNIVGTTKSSQRNTLITSSARSVTFVSISVRMTPGQMAFTAMFGPSSWQGNESCQGYRPLLPHKRTC